MSAALVRKSLAFVDDDFAEEGKSSKSDSVMNFLMPDNQRITGHILKKGRKVQKVNLLQSEKKYTVAEARKTQKSKEAILKANLEKLKSIREACKIKLPEEVTNQIIERAITKRPIRKKEKPKEEQKTAFTEEDFKKFEEEYFDEDL